MSLFESTSRSGVIALNVVLLVSLTVVALVPSSEAQSTPSQRYLALPSTANGITTGVVYIMDTAGKELAAVAWNQNRNKIMTLGYRNISVDISTVPLH